MRWGISCVMRCCGVVSGGCWLYWFIVMYVGRLWIVWRICVGRGWILLLVCVSVLGCYCWWCSLCRVIISCCCVVKRLCLMYCWCVVLFVVILICSVCCCCCCWFRCCSVC